ncbi:3'-5' exonuclease [Ottowia pentelensis]|uniref:3'-5' exonuclease n=1 Tax=Ottowia pentelensis TaxID=511108 RepID=UPI00362E32B7
MSALLRDAGLIGVTISAQNNHADARDAIHFATMHRAKGLEFENVIVIAPSSYLGMPRQRRASAGCSTLP